MTAAAPGWGCVVPAGSFVGVPRRTEHAVTVDAPGTRLLNLYLPAGVELILMGLAALFTDPGMRRVALSAPWPAGA